MAAHVVVVDSTFRNTKVKVTPATFMTEVLEEACRKWNCNASNYDLKNKTKPLDLSLTFRQTGLSPGAKLELVVGSKSPGVVSVALQIPDPSGPGKRLMDKVPSDTTFWRILRKFESSEAANLNFTARGVTEVANGSSGAGRIFYEMPTLFVANRDLTTFGDLQKTLGSVGVRGGSALIKLTFKKTDQPLEEAMTEIGQYFKEEEKIASGATESEAAPAAEVEGVTEGLARMSSAEPSGEDIIDMKDQPAEADEPTSLITPSKRPAPITPEETVLGPDQRPISVFAAPSSNVPKAALQPHNEDDYEPTVAHAKLHQSRLLNNSQNKRLLSDKEAEELEKEKVAKLATMKEVVIKLRFPDQSSIQAPFTAEATAAYLYEYTSKLIVAEDQPFKLVWSGDRGPQTVPKDEKNSKKKLVKDLGLVGRVVVNLVWEDGASDSARKGSTLKEMYAEKAQQVVVPVVAAEETKADAAPSNVDRGRGNENSKEGGGKGKGMPKWFKGLGKK